MKRFVDLMPVTTPGLILKLASRRASFPHYPSLIQDFIFASSLPSASSYLDLTTMGDTKKIEEEQTNYGTHDIPSVHEAPAGVLEEGSLDPVYEAKARVLNKAIQDIGMGKYQWQVNLKPALYTFANR